MWRLTPRTRRQTGAIVVCGTVALVVLAWVVHRFPESPLDRFGVEHRSDNGRLLNWANDVLDLAGSGIAAVALIGAIARLSWYRWRSLSPVVFAVLAPAISVFCAEVFLKPLVSRRLPGLRPVHTWPSGTTALTMSVALVIVVLLAIHHGRLRRRDVVGAAAATGIVLASLFLTGYHWLTDLLGGILLGATVTLAVLLGVARMATPRIAEERSGAS